MIRLQKETLGNKARNMDISLYIWKMTGFYMTTWKSNKDTNWENKKN